MGEGDLLHASKGGRSSSLQNDAISVRQPQLKDFHSEISPF